MKKYLRNYVEDNINNIIMIFLCIIIGLVIGIIIFNISDINTKDQLINGVNETLEISKNDNFEGVDILYNGITSNIIILICINFAALTLIPKLLINGVSFFKGIAIGTYIPIIFSLFKLGDGVVITIILIILPNIIYIPSYIFICNNSLLLHDKIMENNLKVANICIELFKILISFSMIILSVIVEQVVVMVVITNYIL